MRRRSLALHSVIACCTLAITNLSLAQVLAKPEDRVRISANWNNVIFESQTSVSMEVCVESPMRRGSPIHDQLFKAMRNLEGDYVRLVHWRPYPKLAVAELDPPHDGKTFWDFSGMDPVLAD